MDEDEVRLRVAQLAQRFLQRAKGEAAALQAMLESAHSSDAVMSGELEQLAHKIHGSGMTFGFLAVGRCAASIEHSIEEYKSRTYTTGAGLEPKLRERLLECARQLVREIEVAAAP